MLGFALFSALKGIAVSTVVQVTKGGDPVYQPIRPSNIPPALLGLAGGCIVVANLYLPWITIGSLSISATQAMGPGFNDSQLIAGLAVPVALFEFFNLARCRRPHGLGMLLLTIALVLTILFASYDAQTAMHAYGKGLDRPYFLLGDAFHAIAIGTGLIALAMLWRLFTIKT